MLILRPWIFWFFVADNNRRHLEGTDFLGDQGIQSSAKLMDMYHLDLGLDQDRSSCLDKVLRSLNPTLLSWWSLSKSHLEYLNLGRERLLFLSFVVMA